MKEYTEAQSTPLTNASRCIIPLDVSLMGLTNKFLSAYAVNKPLDLCKKNVDFGSRLVLIFKAC